MIEWYKNLALRERQFLVSGAAILMLLLAYVLIYEPLQNGLKVSQETLTQKRSEFNALIDISHKYKQLGTADSSQAAEDNRSLLAIIDQSGSAIGIKSSIKRLTPEGENKVLVLVEDIAFDKLAEWLVANSTKHSIHAELFLVRQADENGIVNATLLFSKGQD